jgi:tetratricopeptide (TPR) repeat protein
VSLLEIQREQQAAETANLKRLLELAGETERQRDLAGEPIERERAQLQLEHLRKAIDEGKGRLARLEDEMKNASAVAASGNPTTASFRADIDDDLPAVELDQLFRAEVETILRSLGHQVVAGPIDGLPGHAPPTFIAEQEGDFEVIRSLFQCTYGRIDDRTVMEFQSVLSRNQSALSLRSGRVVTNSYVAPQARELAARYQIKVLSFEELVNTVFRVTEHLESKCRDYEQTNPLYHSYVEVKYLRKGKGRFSDSRATPQEILVVQDPAETWFEAKGDLTPYVDAWLLEPGGGQICLLGDYGTGKTSFASHYFWKRAQAYLSDPLRNRIPLLVPLNRYHKSTDVEQMMTAFLVNECHVRRDFKTFLGLAARGKLLIILDGFDEMARQVDGNVRSQNFRDLSRLLVGANKVILSGRPNYFLAREEIESIFAHPANHPDPYRVALRRATAPARPLSQILTLSLFDRWQIEAFLQKQSAYLKEKGFEDWRELHKVISETYNLEELARTPVLLEIILKTISELKGSVSEINAARLYELYTGFWLERDYDKGEVRWLIKREDKEIFVVELAWSMLSNSTAGEPEIHFSQLSDRVRAHFQLERAAEVDYFSSDIRFCSYLVHSDSDSSYRFVHRSFMEYFCARRIQQAIATGSLGAVVTDKPLPDEVLFFLSQMVGPAEVERVVAVAARERSPQHREFAAKLAVRLLQALVEAEQRRGAYAAAIDLAERMIVHCEAFGLDEHRLSGLNTLIELVTIAGDLENAAVRSAQAQALALALGDRLGEVRALTSQGLLRELHEDFAQAMNLYQKALGVVGESDSGPERGNIYARIGRLCETQGKLAEARRWLELALGVFEPLPERSGLSSVLRELGRLCRRENRPAEALEHWHRALALSREAADRTGEGVLSLEMASLYRATGEYAHARITLESATQSIRETADAQLEARILMARGALALDTSEPAQALAHYDAARSAASGDPVGEGLALLGLARCREAMGDLHRATEACRQANLLLEASTSRRDWAASLTELGRLARRAGRVAEARRLLPDARRHLLELDDFAGATTALRELGLLAMDEKDPDTAHDLLAEAVYQSRERGDQQSLADGLQCLGRFEDLAGRLRVADERYGEALKIHEELSNQRGIFDDCAALADLALRQEEKHRFVKLYERHREVATRIGLPVSPSLEEKFRALEEMGDTFVAGSLVRWKEEFFGRSRELETILALVNDRSSVLLSGARGIGKTSLLFQVMKSLGDGFLPVYADAGRFVSHGLAMLEGILRTVIEEAEAKGLIARGRWTGMSLTYGDELFTALDSVVAEMEERGPCGCLVLVIDGAERLIEDSLGSTLEVLRMALARSKDVVVVLSMDSQFRLRSTLVDDTQFHHVSLGVLSDHEVDQFLSGGRLRGDADFDPAARRSIFEWSGGIPYLVRVIAASALRFAARNERRSVEAGDVDLAINDLRPAVAPFIASSFFTLPTPDQYALRHLAREGRRPGPATVDQLSNEGRLRLEGRSYRVSPRLLEDLLKSDAIDSYNPSYDPKADVF